MAIPEYILEKNKGLNEWCILLMYRGSIAHEMYVPKSNPNSIDDKDLLSVCIPSKDHYFGLKEFHSRGTKEIKENEWDIVIYEFRKFIRLLQKGNPNVLYVLWLNNKHFIWKSDITKPLFENKNIFVGKHVYKSFTGYAYGQLKRMENHACQGYMGEKRKQLVEKFGYDTKNASHLIRLLKMSIEFLTEGKLYVERHDAQQLLQIKNGAWSLEKVKKEADRLFTLADEAYVKSKLPNGPENEAINKLCCSIINNYFELRRNKK